VAQDIVLSPAEALLKQTTRMLKTDVAACYVQVKMQLEVAREESAAKDAEAAAIKKDLSKRKRAKQAENRAKGPEGLAAKAARKAN